ncbi:hypothetical protein VE00_10497 [Pseudogymnoascus sp. WSF 3629]|nr:hypothetical protein VE00_10497 [Pseudogymnoascus sp. WSF 3629]
MEYTAKKLPNQSILETLMTDLLSEDRQVNKSLMVDNGQNGMVLYGNHPKSQNQGRPQNSQKKGKDQKPQDLNETSRSERPKRPTCSHCKQTSHLIDKCFELHPEKRLAG